MNILGPCGGGPRARRQFQRSLQGIQRARRIGIIHRSGFQMHAEHPLGGGGHGSAAPDRDPPHHRADGIGHPGMLGQDHLTAKPCADCRIIAPSRRAEAHHRHVQPGVQPHQPLVPVQPPLSQRMARELFGGQAEIYRLFGKPGFQYGQNGLVRQAPGDHLRHFHRAARQHISPARPPPRHQAQRLFSRFRVPYPCRAQNMAGIGRGHARDLHQPASDKAAQGLRIGADLQDRRHRLHSTLDNPRQQNGVAIRQTASLDAGDGAHECRIVIARHRPPELRVQRAVDHLRRLLRNQASGQHPARPKRQTTLQPVLQMHLAIAAKAGGMHRHRLDHGAPGANLRAGRIDHRAAATQNGHIRGSATDIRYQRRIHPSQPTRPDDGGGGAAQDCLDGAGACLCGADQRAIAAHHHEGRGNAQIAQLAPGLPDQPGDHADQPRIQDRRQRPLRPVQPGRQMVRA